MAKANPYAEPRCIRLMIVFCCAIVALFLATPVQANSPIHVVQPGDSLSQIAVRYGVSMSALVAANGIGNTNYIYTGQQLVIPAGSTNSRTQPSAAGGTGYVTVGRGDSLSLIASLQGMTVNELMALNGLTNPNHVWIGQQLRVTGGAGASSPSYTAAVTDGSIHVVQAGQTLSQIGRRYGLSVQQLMGINGLSNPNHVYVGQRLQVVGGSSNTADRSYAPAAGAKRIEVNLATQTLTAWHGDSVALYTSISSGTGSTPTVTGRYRIDRKYAQQRMVGPGYDIPDVPWVMYFWDGYAFHGAYWHNNFGIPMSHGCIHLRPSEAEYLYNWADFGTEVYVHW